MEAIINGVVAVLTVVGLLVFWKFWKHFLAKRIVQALIWGFIGSLFWGFIGSLFGDEWRVFGVVFGFVNGFIRGFIDSEQKEEENKNKKTSPSFEKTQPNNSIESRIILCPSCKNKIRVSLPLQGEKGKCVACSNYFLIRIDAHGNLKVDKQATENTSKPNQGHTATLDHFKVLGVEPTATPDEVRASYKRKIQEYHPDRVAGLGEKLKKMAEGESKAINKAYSALKSKGLAS